MGSSENLWRNFLFFSSVFVLVSVGLAAPDNPDTFLAPNPVYDDNNAYCTGDIVDYDVSQMDVTVNWSVSSDQIYNETLIDVSNNSLVNSTLGSSNFTEGQEVLCNITVFNGSIGSAESSWEYDSIIAETFDPVISSGPDFSNYTRDHAFNVSAVVTDREGEDELRECRLNVTDGSNQVWKTMNMDKTYGDSTEVLCTFSRIENTSDFQVLEDLQVMMWANDSGGGVGNLTRINPVPNNPPVVYDIEPEDDSETAASTVTLEASVLDRNGEQMNVSFYEDTGSGILLHENQSMGQETTTHWDWNGLSSLDTYYWYVNVSDGHEYVIERFRFRNLMRSQFRVDTDFLYRYSAIVMSPNRSRVVPYTVRNTASSAKNDLNTSVVGADGVLASYGSSSSGYYDLSPGEEKTFRIQVSPDVMGKKYVNVTTENSNYGIETVDRMEVFVTDRPTNRPEVPGIGLLQLLMVLFLSTLYYSGRL